MKKTLQRLKQFWYDNTITIIVTMLFTLGIVIIIAQSASVKRAKQRQLIAENNVSVYQDSIRHVTDKWKAAEFQRKSFVVQEAQDLKELTAPLYEAISRLEGKITSIQKTEVVVNQPDVTIPIQPIGDSKYNFSFDTTYSPGNFESFKGQFDTDALTTVQRNRKIGVSLLTGIRDNKGKPEIFVKSTFPGLTVTGLEGAQIDPKVFRSEVAKEPLIRATLNVGQNTATYNYNDKKAYFFRPEINATVGASINLNKVFKKR